MIGDCIKCFQPTRHNRRHCEECLAEKRRKYMIKRIKERCHPDNRCFFPEVFGYDDLQKKHLQTNDKKE